MSRYLGPRLKIVRRLGVLPGLTQKVSKKEDPPGQHGKTNAKKKPKQYSERLKEKQKLRYNYGLTERQLLRYVRKARKQKGSAGENLLQLLEMRLDNIIFRVGLAPTIVAARQFINHGHILVNKKPVSIASYICNKEDLIQIRNQSVRFIEDQRVQDTSVPKHLDFNESNLTATIKKTVDRQDIGVIINERLIVEYYSRKA